MADGTVAGGAAPRPISVILARLAQAKDADLLLREALDAAIDIAGADMGNIQLLEPANGSLKIGASRGFSAPFLDFFATVSAHTNSACGATLVNRMRIMVEDVATSYLFVATPALDIMLVANARSVHSTPLLSSSGRLMGVMSTHWRRPLRGMPYDPAPLDRLAVGLADRLQEIESRRSTQDASIRERPS
jgi:GAF domain-containing protein